MTGRIENSRRRPGGPPYRRLRLAENERGGIKYYPFRALRGLALSPSPGTLMTHY